MHMYNVSSEYQNLQQFTMISSIFTPQEKMRHPFRQRWKKLVLAEAPLPADPRHTQSVTRARILPRGSVPRLPHSGRYQPRRDQQRLIQDSKLLPSKLPPAPGPFPFKGRWLSNMRGKIPHQNPSRAEQYGADKKGQGNARGPVGWEIIAGTNRRQISREDGHQYPDRETNSINGNHDQRPQAHMPPLQPTNEVPSRQTHRNTLGDT